MTPNHPIRFAQALVLAAIVAALAAPTVALAGSNSRYARAMAGTPLRSRDQVGPQSRKRDSNRYGPHDGWYTYAHR